MDAADAQRRRLLESCGAPPETIEPLLTYGAQPCRWGDGVPLPAMPLADGAQVAAWLDYEREAAEDGALRALSRHLVQLRFPVEAGMSEQPAYRQATRRGAFDAADAFAPGLQLNDPAGLSVMVCSSIAGRLPVLITRDRGDFERLVQALTSRNEPTPVPAGMGACLVKGLNNWSRIAAYRAAWTRDHPGADEAAWADEFQRLLPHKELYQDRLVILSSGPYSATPAAATGLVEAAWIDRSIAIRREHELTHLFVHRVFGVMRMHVFDEIVADFVGLARAFGDYRPELALRFFGLERYPEYRAGGRLEIYLAESGLPDAAIAVVHTIAWRAVHQLAAFSRRWQGRWEDLTVVSGLVFALSQLALEELAMPELADLVEARLP